MSSSKTDPPAKAAGPDRIRDTGSVLPASPPRVLTDGVVALRAVAVADWPLEQALSKDSDGARWAIERAGEPCGTVGVGPRGQGGVEIFYALLRGSRGHGTAARAARLLTDWAYTAGANEIALTTFQDNEASQRTARRAGYRPVGREPRTVKGGEVDLLLWRWDPALRTDDAWLPMVTGRLILRTHIDADIEALQREWDDPVVWRYVGAGRAGVSTADITRGVEGMRTLFAERGYCGLVVERSDDGRVLGECGLYRWRENGRDTEEVELGYRFGAEHWGKGYAGEAAAAVLDWARQGLGLTHLLCVVQAPNVAGRRIAERLGFRLAETRLATYGRATVVNCYYRWDEPSEAQ